VIEGVSLVGNYRSQFRDILKTKSPEDLIEVLRKKVNRA
jgi:ABC-type transporter MlaC component